MKRTPEYDIKILAAKWLDGTINAEEKKYFEQWYNSFDHSKLFLSDEDEEPRRIEARLLECLKKELEPVKEKGKSAVMWIRIMAAAAVLLIISAGLHFYLEREPELKITQNRSVTVIVPGGNKAILTLSDGSTISLDGAKQGLLAKQGDIQIQKTSEGKLKYESAPNPGGNSGYNTISTPKGGQYQLTLPDGTKVWLNAASSLRFPTRFTSTERLVELDGEAYFEVAKNPVSPFLVKTNSQTVKVLGTHFNVSAYGDEPSTKTTLLEGSIVVSHQSSSEMLNPGQQSQIAANGKIKISDVNTTGTIAWKNGYFQFKNEKIEEIMRKVARWYDVEVSYQSGYSQKGFTGTISRFEDVSKVLRMLELTGIVHFKIEGRRIIVMP